MDFHKGQITWRTLSSLTVGNRLPVFHYGLNWLCLRSKQRLVSLLIMKSPSAVKVCAHVCYVCVCTTQLLTYVRGGVGLCKHISMVKKVSIPLFSCLTFTAHLLLPQKSNNSTSLLWEKLQSFLSSLIRIGPHLFGQECLRKVLQLLTEAILFYKTYKGIFCGLTCYSQSIQTGINLTCAKQILEIKPFHLHIKWCSYKLFKHGL